MGLAKPKAEVQANIDPRIRVRLVTGGSETGKEALIRGLLSRADGVVRAIVLPRSIDPDAFGSSSAFIGEDGLTLFPDGNICIPMTDGLLAALNQLHLRWMGNLEPALFYDQVSVVVPATVDAAHYATQLHTDPRLDLTYLFDGIDTVLDAEDALNLHKAEVEKRIAQADTITVNIDNGDIEHILQAVGAINPFAEISGFEDDRPGARMTIKPVRIPGDAGLNRTIGGTCLVNNLFNNRRTNQADAGVIRAMQAEVPGATNIQRLYGHLQELREALGDDLFRLRGTTHIRHGDYPIGFQMVGRSWTPPFYEDDPGDPRTRIQIVARGLDPEAAFDQLRSCVWCDDDVTSRRVPLF